MPALRPSPRARLLHLGFGAFILGTATALPAAAQPASQANVQQASPAEVADIQRLIKDGQHAQALKLIEEALAKNPKDAQMRFRRGVALSMLDRKAEALTVFQKLVEDHPDMPAPYNNMAVIYGAQGEYEKARGALERAIRTNPAYATAYQNLGDVYAQLASQAYSKALQLDKSDASVQPKLSLLRELTSGTAVAAAAPTRPTTPPAVATVPVAKTNPPPTVVAAAPAPAPAVAAKPAPAPAPAAPKPTPAPKPVEPPRPAANPNTEVEAAVKAWASAWSRRDMGAYVAAYAGDFAGQAKSHKAWEQERRDRIAGKKSIKVGVSDLKVSVHGDRATARFRQSYDSDALSTSSRKTLELVRNPSGKWVIHQEAVGG